MLFILIFPSLAIGQNNGIEFRKAQSWTELLRAAGNDGKLVFVTCAIPRSADCQRMEKDVFSDSTIGSFFNSRFLSIKMLLDSANEDGLKNRQQMQLPIDLQKFVAGKSFPVYLFFTSAGTLVHQGMGVRYGNFFMELGNEALKPETQYFPLLEKFRKGVLPYTSMPYLARTAGDVNDKEVADKVSKKYLHNYLLLLPPDSLLTKSNIEFLAAYAQSDDKVFSLFYNQEKIIDEIMNQEGYTRQLIDQAITYKFVEPRLWRDRNYAKPLNEQPEWLAITQLLSSKYGTETAERIMLNAKVKWYGVKMDWAKYTDNLITIVERFGPPMPVMGNFTQDFKYNWNAWEIFKHSYDKKSLVTALVWSETAIKIVSKPDAQYYDTYANILYKLGRRKEAITWQKKAAELNPQANDIQDNLSKMNNNEPTWPQ